MGRNHRRIGTMSTRIKCDWPGCKAWLAPGRGMSIHKAKEHGDLSRRFRTRGPDRKWVYHGPVSA